MRSSEPSGSTRQGQLALADVLQTNLHLAHADALRRAGCHEYRLGRNLCGQLKPMRSFCPVNLNDGSSGLGNGLGHFQRFRHHFADETADLGTHEDAARHTLDRSCFDEAGEGLIDGRTRAAIQECGRSERLPDRHLLDALANQVGSMRRHVRKYMLVSDNLQVR